MSFTLTIANSVGTYVFDPSPNLVINRTFTHDDIGLYLKKTEVWTISGILVIKELTALTVQIAELNSYAEIGTLTSAIFKEDAAAKETLPNDDGIRIKSLTFPEGAGPEWATVRKFVMVLEGTDRSAAVDTDGEYEYTITYSTEQSGIITRTINGVLRDTGASNSSAAKYATLKTAQSWATWAGANLITDSYTINKDDTECAFTIVHKKYWTEYGTGITNASVSTSSIRDNQNGLRYRISGWFEGGELSCANAIRVLDPLSGVLIHKEISRNDYTNRTSFSLSYFDTATDIYSFQESITITMPIFDAVYKRVLGGGAPVKQFTSWTTARAVQRGRIIRLKKFPALPKPLWDSTYLKHSEYQKVFPENKTQDGYSVYVLNYIMAFEFSNLPYVPYPSSF